MLRQDICFLTGADSLEIQQLIQLGIHLVKDREEILDKSEYSARNHFACIEHRLLSVLQVTNYQSLIADCWTGAPTASFPPRPIACPAP